MAHAINEALARKVLKAVDAGLVRGLGTQEPGKMCVEAVICFALGLPHGDNPPCVGYAVRAFKIRLNDAAWSSNEARTKGMRQVAIAQLGSDEIDQRAFAEYVAIETVKRILPIALRAAISTIEDETRKAAIEVTLAACEACTDLATAKAAADAANAAAYAANAAAYAADAAANAAANAADAAAAKDNVLALAARIAVEGLTKLGAAGVQWLGLCD